MKNYLGKYNLHKVKICLKYLPLIILCICVNIIFFYLFQNFGIKRARERGVSILVTIDSLITSSTIAFIAFTNYAASSSGSSIVLKKCSWGSLHFGKLQKILFVNTHFLVILTILISMMDAIVIPFVPDIYNWSYLSSNVILSSLILIIIIVKYYYFHSKLYENGAHYIVYQITNIIKCTSNKNMDKSKIKFRKLLRTYFNPLLGSQNATLKRILLQELKEKVINNKAEDKFSKEITPFLKGYINNRFFFKYNEEHYANFSIYISYEFHNTKINRQDFSDVLRQFCLDKRVDFPKTIFNIKENYYSIMTFHNQNIAFYSKKKN